MKKGLIQKVNKLVLSQTAKSTYIIFLGNSFSAFFAFLFTVTYVRNFSFADVGYFSALWSLLLLVSDLADIGIGTSMSRFLPPLSDAKERLYAFLKTAFTTQMTIAVFTCSMLIIFSNQISVLLFHNSDFGYLIRITALGILFTIGANFTTYVLSARQQFVKAGFLSAFSGLLRLILLLLIIRYSILNLHNLVISQVVALCILMLVSFYFLKFDFLKIARVREDLYKLLSFTVFLGIARGLTAIASRLDVLMLVALKNPVEAGIYATAVRVISFYPMLSGSFSTVIAPKLSTIKDRDTLRKFINKVIFATFGLIATIILLIIFASHFMIILFGQKGSAAVSVFQLLLFSMIFFVGSIPVVSLAIYYLKKPAILTVNSVIQLGIVAIGNLVLIPIFGKYGAAISLILAYGITLITTSVLCLYYIKKKHDK